MTSFYTPVKNGGTPLHYLMEHADNASDCLTTLNVLLQHKPDVNKRNKQGKTPLHLLFQNKNLWKNTDILNALLAAGADVNLIDEDNSPFHLDGNQNAHESSTSAVMRNASSSQVNDLNDKLLKSVYNNDLNKVKELVNEDGKSPLHLDGNQNAQDSTSAVSRNACSSQANDLNDNILKSVYNNDLNKVKELIKVGANINAQGYVCEGNYILYTPLILAAENGYVELLESLLRAPGINVNQGGEYGFTALHKASMSGHVEIVKLLLEKVGIDVNLKDTKYGYTPLILAASGGHEEIVDKLLGTVGILVNEKNKNGQTALHKSASNGHTEVVKMLLNVQGVLINEKDDLNYHTPLHLAADSGYTDVVEVILTHSDTGVNIKDKYGQTALHTSAYHGNLKIVSMLLKAGVNVNEKTGGGFTVAQLAAKQGHVKVVEMIVSHIKNVGVGVSGMNKGARSKEVNDLTQSIKYVGISGEYLDSNKETNNLNEQLLLAAKNGDLGRVGNLLKQPGIDVNYTDRYKKNTSLHLTSEGGHPKVVKVLLEMEGIEVNAKNKDNTRLAYTIHIGDDPARHKLDIGVTPLYLAVIGGHSEVVKVLVDDLRTNLNAKDKYGQVPLHNAVRQGFIEIVEILLNHTKIDVNVVNTGSDHFTSLHSAVERSNFEIIKMLLNHPNINVNLKDKYYICTPLHLAVRKNALGIVEAILNHPKVDVNLKDKYDNTPLHDAAEKGYLEILNCLLYANANVNIRNILGKTPLHLARENKHLLCMNVLQNA